MEKIGGFFGKFKNKVSEQIINYSFVIEIIKKHTGVEMEMKDILISGGNIKIKASQLVKNEIFIKKTRILKDINQNIRNMKISDIV